MKPLIRTAARTLAVIVAALTLMTVAASADEPSLLTSAPDARSHSGFSIGAHASYYRNNHVIDNDWYPGVDLRLHFGSILALEGSTDYKRAHSINYFPTEANLLVYLTPQYRLTPYITGGGTWYFESGGGSNSNLFGPDAGVGLEYFMTHEWSVDGSWRYLWVERTNSGSNYFNRSYETNGYQVRVGLHYHF